MKDSAAQMGGSLTSLKVPPDMYDELVRECHPATPSDYFGVPIEISELTAHGATVH